MKDKQQSIIMEHFNNDKEKVAEYMQRLIDGGVNRFKLVRFIKLKLGIRAKEALKILNLSQCLMKIETDEKKLREYKEINRSCHNFLYNSEKQSIWHKISRMSFLEIWFWLSIVLIIFLVIN